MANIPQDLKYAKSHEWVRVSGGVATVGITDHAQHELTDVVFVELPEMGRKVNPVRRVQWWNGSKTASDLRLSEIIEVNKGWRTTPLW